MATTAQQVFATAMGLMDQLSPGGAADSPDTREYRDRTLLILNALRGELYPYSDTYDADRRPGRPVAAVIRDMDSVIGLRMEENPGAAAFFQQRYEELRSRLAVGVPARSEDILDLYGGIEYGSFGRW